MKGQMYAESAIMPQFCKYCSELNIAHMVTHDGILVCMKDGTLSENPLYYVAETSKWHFLDETGRDSGYGPFDTVKEALAALTMYASEILTGDEEGNEDESQSCS